LDRKDEGLIPDVLARVLTGGRLKFIYLVPTYQNPSGRTLPLDRRQAVAALLKRYRALLIEGNPYGGLRWGGRARPPIKSLATERMVYVGTLSKLFAPGLRIGDGIAPEAIRKKLVIVKQGPDLQTSTFNQALAAEYLPGGHRQRHQPCVLALYGPRGRAMRNSLEWHFPAEFHWSRPEGGMRVWVQGPERLDMDEVHQDAVARQTVFVPGHLFCPGGGGRSTRRPHFTLPGPDDIRRVVKTLAEIIRDHSPRPHRDGIRPLKEAGFATISPGTTQPIRETRYQGAAKGSKMRPVLASRFFKA
jgi:2-aminoadipate transaminase